MIGAGLSALALALLLIFNGQGSKEQQQGTYIESLSITSVTEPNVIGGAVIAGLALLIIQRAKAVK